VGQSKCHYPPYIQECSRTWILTNLRESRDSVSPLLLSNRDPKFSTRTFAVAVVHNFQSRRSQTNDLHFSAPIRSKIWQKYASTALTSSLWNATTSDTLYNNSSRGHLRRCSAASLADERGGRSIAIFQRNLGRALPCRSKILFDYRSMSPKRNLRSITFQNSVVVFILVL
jgi:hypothetical protein